MRVSDADRQRVIEQLRTHVADGRLTLDEFAGRVGEAWGVRTHGELQTVLRDLPSLRAEPVVQARPRRHTTRPRTGIPTPLLIVALVVAGSLLMSHVAWWLIPVGFWMFGGCRGGRRNHRAEPRATTRDDTLISV